MKAKDIIELLEFDGLKKLAIKQTDLIDDLETSNESWKDKWRNANSNINDAMAGQSEAWSQHTQSQRRVATLFGKFERMARILNQTDDVDGVTDVQIIEQIVDVVSEEINHENGFFVNHKGEEYGR